MKSSGATVRFTLTKKISLLLLMPLIGSLVSIAFFAGFLEETKTDGHFMNVAGRQRMLAAELGAWAHMVAIGQEDRAGLQVRIAEFEKALSAMEQGGEVLDGLLLPAPPEVRGELAAVDNLWRALKPDLIDVAVRPRGEPQFQEAYRRVESGTVKLKDLSHRLVTRFEERTQRLRRRMFYTLGGITCLIGIIFVAGIFLARRYIVQPILRVDEAARRIGAGDFSQRLEIATRDELSVLAYTFNQMVAQTEQLLGALNLRRRHAETIVASVPAGLLVLRGDLAVLRANRSFRETFGVDEQAIARRPMVAELLPVNGLIEAAHEVLSTGEAKRNLPMEMPAKDGSPRWLRITLAGTRLAEEEEEEEEEEEARLLVVVEDVSEEERLRREARAHEAHYQDLVEGLDAIVWEADADTFAFTFVSERAQAILGYPVERWLAEPGFWASLIHPEDRERAVAFCRAATAQGSDHVFEYRAVTADGRVVWLHDAVRVVRDESGRVRQLRGVMVNTTELKQAEEKLARLGRILDNSSNEIYVFDADTLHFVQANQGARQNLGYTLEELKTLTPLDIKPEFTRRSFEELVAPLRRGDRDTVTFETVHQRKDGSRYPVEVRLYSSRAETPPVVVAIIQDIAERKQAEEWRWHYTQTLDLLAAGAPLREVLEGIAVFAERQMDGALCSILLLSSDGKRLVHGAAPSLPEFYNRAIDGIEIGEGVGSCGTAAFTGRTVIVEDVMTHPDWAPWRELAAAASLRACWSEPILSADNQVLGTFALYYREPCTPMPEEMELIRQAARLAAIAIERARSQEELRLAAVVFEQSVEGIMVTDTTERIVMVNRAFAELTGYTVAEAVGQTPSILQSGRQDAAFYRAMWESIRETGRWQGEIWNRRKSGEIHPVWMSIATVRDDKGAPTHHISILIDISEQKVQAARIEQLAFYDPLTGLPNRALFLDRLEQALAAAQRHGQRVALLFLDLNRFKEINDTQGHAIGDLALAEVARRFQATLRQEETLARLAGDEFVVITAGADQAAAILIAERLQQALGEPLAVKGHTFSLSVSIGIAFYPEDGKSPEDLLKHTDIAMYRAKTSGGGYRFYRPEMGAELAKRLEVAKRLGKALEAGKLQLYYQPQVNLQTGKATGAEALARWHDPEWGWVSPAQFIPIAEERGIIGALGEWLLTEACRQVKVWQEAGLSFPGRLAVNLAAQQLEEPDIAGRIQAIVHGAGLTPALFELELTESGMMANPERAVAVMQAFKAGGFALSIDDFGTGYSSLAYLKRFPADKLKIDISFVRDMLNDRNDHTIVATIIAMARTLELKTVAEGVEEAAQAEALWALGCDEAQGYYFGRPEPAEVFAQKWLGSNACE